MDRVDCDACKYGYYEEDKMRCELEHCSPDYCYQCSDCEKFSNCEITQGASCEPCLEFEKIN